MRSITQMINEASDIRYNVDMIGCEDDEGMPIPIVILIDRADKKYFEKFLEKEKGNIFSHVSGGSVEY